jgi:hypothetical protein
MNLVEHTPASLAVDRGMYTGSRKVIGVDRWSLAVDFDNMGIRAMSRGRRRRSIGFDRIKKEQRQESPDDERQNVGHAGPGRLARCRQVAEIQWSWSKERWQ